MDIVQIESCLDSSDPQLRLRGITALRGYQADLAVPLLQRLHADQAVMVRSFVAIGLGHKQNSSAFHTLVDLLQTDGDANVRAEAANSLAKYGEAAVPLLVTAFHDNPAWIIRISILLALMDSQCPDQLLALAIAGLSDGDVTVQETAVQCLAHLARSEVRAAALEHVLSLAVSTQWSLRRQAALALPSFVAPSAQSALAQLRQDPDHRVVGAVLEALV
jgi:HEAT repeat protein